jgi:tetratricopeptide (TPR) repeat protein
MADEPEIKAQIHTTIGDTYGAIGRYDLAEPHFEAALKIRRELFGDRGVKIAESLYYLGGVKFLKGDWLTSERLYQEALSIQREMPNEGNNLPYMLLDMGNLLAEKADTTSAETLFREALDIFRNKNGEEHITVAIAHEYLGFVFNTRGDLDAAQAEYEEAMRLFENAPAENLAKTKTKLGQIHTAKGEYKEAESYLRDSLRLLRQQYGDKSERAIDARSALAYLLYRKGEYPAAKREVEDVLQLDLQLLREGWTEFASAQTLLGMILNKTGKHARGEACLRDALSIYTRAKPQAERGIAGIKGALGECLMDQKRYDEAESFLTESYNALKLGQVPQSPTLRETMSRLATLYEKWGKLSLAAQFGAQLGQSK